MSWYSLPVLVLFARTVTAVVKVKVGVMLISELGSPYDYERTVAAIDLAVDKINTEILDNNSHQLVPFIRKYGPKCDAASAPGKLWYLYGRFGSLFVFFICLFVH